MYKLFYFVLILLFCMSGCGNNGNDNFNSNNNTCEWLYLSYVASDNNLGDYNDMVPYKSRNVINLLETVGSTNKVKCVALLDERLSNTKQYLIEQDDNYKIINSKCIYDYGQNIDSGNSEIFENFIKMNIEKFQPQKVVVEIWNHGSGPISRDSVFSMRGICFDHTSNNNITGSQLKNSLLNIKQIYGEKIQALVLSACYMGNYETAYELRNCAKYILASPPTIWGKFTGYYPALDSEYYRTLPMMPFNPCDDFLRILNSKETTEDIMCEFCDSSIEKHQLFCGNNSSFISLYNTSYLNEIQIEFIKLSNLLNAQYEQYESRVDIANAIDNSASYEINDGTHYDDLKDFGVFVKNIEKCQNLSEETKLCAAKLSNILYDEHKFIVKRNFYMGIDDVLDWNDCCGVSLYFPSAFVSGQFLTYDVFQENENWKNFIFKHLMY